MVKDPKNYDLVWAFNNKHIAVQYEVYGIHNGTLHLRHKQGHRIISKEHVFATVEDMCEDVKSYAQSLL